MPAAVIPRRRSSRSVWADTLTTCWLSLVIFFFNDTATTEIYTLSYTLPYTTLFRSLDGDVVLGEVGPLGGSATVEKLATKDRKSTRLNSSHIQKSRMPSSA